MENFAVTSTITYRPYRIPPHCRKPRPVVESFTHEFQIPCFTSDEVPVVAFIPDDRGYLGAPDGGDAPLRARDGQLYAAMTTGRNAVKAGSDFFPATRRHDSFTEQRSLAVNDAGRDLDGVIIVDGMVWKPATEPSYTIMTMGLGGNHGGTYLELSVMDRGVPGRRFPLTEYEAAVEATVEFAKKRGDTASIPMIRRTPKATILDPSVFRIPSAAERLSTARKEALSLADQASELLTGTIDRDVIRSARKLLEEADGLFFQHGLERAER